MQYAVLLLLFSSLASCASLGDEGPAVISSNATGISFAEVSADVEAKAMRIADAHCAKYGKLAQIAERRDFWLVVHCVKE